MQQAIRTTVSNNVRKSRDHQPLEKKTAPTNSKEHPPTPRRTATVYDAVAGRVGLNGILKPSDHQATSSSSQPFSTRLRPEEVLLRRVGAPDQIPYGYYDADQRLDGATQKLPDSELLKEIHAYVSQYYEATAAIAMHDVGGIKGQDQDQDRGGIDFKSFDETALLAMGILMEEVCQEVLGEDGDMVFSEPVGYGRELPRSAMSRYQVVGKVIPEMVREYEGSESSGDEDDDVERLEEGRPRKRARRRYRDLDGV